MTWSQLRMRVYGSMSVLAIMYFLYWVFDESLFAAVVYLAVLVGGRHPDSM